MISVRTEIMGSGQRSDVQVVFADGNRVVLEAQRSPVTDAQWRHRHHDYARNEVVDAWFWHPDSPTP
ncbi:hypothetical protein ABIA39_005699 [Nocardia sp. GAS34]|uniref:competence protein CoiA family protein n=1 Tax=unclassified Nocardia TaxID=2637762 RepID=UPI003D24DA25